MLQHDSICLGVDFDSSFLFPFPFPKNRLNITMSTAIPPINPIGVTIFPKPIFPPTINPAINPKQQNMPIVKIWTIII